MEKKTENTNNTNIIMRFCCECGSKFEATSKQARICPACAAKKKAEQKKIQAAYAKERQERLGLVNITVSKTTRDYARAEAAKKGVSIYQIIDAIVEQEKARQEKENVLIQEEEEKPKKAAAKKK